MYPTPPWMRSASVAISNAVSLANSFAIPASTSARSPDCFRSAACSVSSRAAWSLRAHVGELLLDRLVLARSACRTLRSCAYRIAASNAARATPHRARRDVDAADLERAEDEPESVTETLVAAEHAVGADAVVVVDHLDGLDALVPELADVLRDRDAAERRAGLLLDDEARDALVGARRERDDPGPLAVRHPRLGAADHVLLAVALGAARDVARVAAGVGLGEREAAAQLARREPRQPALPAARACPAA